MIGLIERINLYDKKQNKTKESFMKIYQARTLPRQVVIPLDDLIFLKKQKSMKKNPQDKKKLLISSSLRNLKSKKNSFQVLDIKKVNKSKKLQVLPSPPLAFPRKNHQLFHKDNIKSKSLKKQKKESAETIEYIFQKIEIDPHVIITQGDLFVSKSFNSNLFQNYNQSKKGSSSFLLHSNFDSRSKLNIRPKSSFKNTQKCFNDENTSNKCDFFTERRTIEIESFYQKIDRNRQKKRIQINYPDIKINPPPLPKLPNPPNKNMEASEYIDRVNIILKILDVKINGFDGWNIKRFKNCIVVDLDESQQKVLVWYYSGKVYLGGWEEVDNGQGKKVKWGMQIIPEESFYRGQYRQGKKHGLGLLQDHDGNIYDGKWRNGCRQGQGVYFQKKNHSYYQGHWKKDKKQGKGVLQFGKKQYYDGFFVNDKAEGEGIEVLENGDTYKGIFKKGKFDGIGTYFWHNDCWYYGQFYQGKRHGLGLWKKDSSTYFGQYRNDVRDGYGIFEEDEKSYHGFFRKNNREGRGVLIYPNGGKVYGNFSNDELISVQMRSLNVTMEQKMK